MRSAIRKHLGDFLAIVALFVLALGVAAYILSQQRLRFPLLEEKPTSVYVELPDAQAVQPGRGQTVRVAGVKVGDIGNVRLEDGRAVVQLQIDPKYKHLIRRDATALLRTKTGLKDMFVEVDPGTGKPISDGGRIPIENTAPDIDPDEILSALDADTRDYLKLLISGAGKGLEGHGGDLRETFRRLGPVHRDLARVTQAIARRRHNLRTLVHNYGLLTSELGRKDEDITRLVQTANAVLGALASQDRNISATVAKLPGTLRTTAGTLGKVGRYSRRLRPTLESLRPAIRKLDPANDELLPLAKEGTPVVRNQIRPFARAAQPFVKDFGEGARGVTRAEPDLSKSFLELNRFFNIGAYNPGGAQGLTGNLAADRARNEGYLYWLGWLASNTNSVFSTADANGPFRRITLGSVPCNLLALALVQAIPDFQQLPAPAKDLLGIVPGLDPSQLPTTITNRLGELGVCAVSGK